MIYDLHSHSTFSDGALSPEELFERAADKGVTHLALTDHDTTAGLEEAATAAEKNGISLIPGVEISVRWRDYEIHIVGINIDPQNTVLKKGLERHRKVRVVRFERMVQKLADAGIEGTEVIVHSYANGEHVGRPTVAKFLVENDYCDFSEAYEYLGKGGKFHVTSNWEFMNYAVKWINDAGGIAVIAHPDSYGMTLPAMRGLMREFKEVGGKAIEVCYGACSKAAINRCAHFAREYELHGSTGSDFHRPSPGIELGKLKSLPRNVTPVWELLV